MQLDPTNLFSKNAFTSAVAPTITTGGTPNVKTSWTQLVGSTPYDMNMIELFITITNAANSLLLDIGIGSGGSELVVVNNILAAGASQVSHVLRLPLFIPAGSRVAVRAQGAMATEQIRVSFTGWFENTTPNGAWTETYGANTGDSGGTLIDPGGSSNTKGAWVELTAATAIPIKFLILCIGHAEDTTRSTGGRTVDIGYGAAGSEIVLVPDIALISSSGTDNVTPLFNGAYVVDIPAGTRLAVRAQCSFNTANDREFDATLIGVAA